MNNTSAFFDFECNDPFDRLLLVAQCLVRIEKDPQVVRDFQAHVREVFSRSPESPRKDCYQAAIALELQGHPSDEFASEGFQILVHHLLHRPAQEGIPGWVWHLFARYLPDNEPTYQLVCALNAMLIPCDDTLSFCPLIEFFACVERVGYTSVLEASDVAFFTALYEFVNCVEGGIYPFDPGQEKSPFFEALNGFLADFWTADFWKAFDSDRVC